MSCHMMSHDGSHDRHGKVVHKPCSSCISSVQEIHKNSIEFSLSSTDKGAVGFILAQELAILTAACSIYLGLDLSIGYDHCTLAEESRDYTTFDTPLV